MIVDNERKTKHTIMLILSICFESYPARARSLSVYVFTSFRVQKSKTTLEIKSNLKLDKDLTKLQTVI